MRLNRSRTRQITVTCSRRVWYHSSKVAQSIGSFADGVIIGSALVDLIDKNSQLPAMMLDEVSRFISEVRVALDG